MEFVTSPWFGLMTFMMGVLVSIFSPDLRGWLLEVVSRPSRALTSRRLKAMERRVDLLKRMQSSPILIQGFFASYLFIALMLLSVMVVMTALLVVTVGISKLLVSMVLALFWAWFIRIINTPMDVSLQLNDPAAAINKLEEKIAQARKM
ncbi:MAG TPA: hypothetical protein PLF19_03815 [Ottowia sp.]|nr:hypothetical protein [Ottowia sp.]